MATNLTLGDILEVKYFLARGPQNGINVIRYQVTNLAGTGASDQAVIDALSTAAAVPYKAYLDTGSSYSGIRGQIISPAVRPAVVSLLGAGAGARVADQLPPQITLLLSTRSAVAGRAGRGRTYLPFWTESDSTVGGIPSAAALTLAGNTATVLFNNYTVGGGGNTVTVRPVVFGPETLLPGLFIINVIVRTAWATQRRRSFINRNDTLGP